MTSSAHSDKQNLDDNDLVELELAMERGEPVPHQDGPTAATHRQLYGFIEDIASPIRMALTTDTKPPTIPDYDELYEIGRGGMGIVYRATHVKTQRTEAIKVIRPDRLQGVTRESLEHLKFRFHHESMLAARVAHESIVPIYQVGEIAGSPWFSMQWVDGESLQQITSRAKLRPEQAARYIERIARAVGVVHRHGILHGDIKPHNILVETEQDRPLLTDFGLAYFDDGDANLDTKGVTGTPAYMAPELTRAARENRSPVDVAAIRSTSSDIYSLGATLYAALTGSPPVPGEASRHAPIAPSRIPNPLLRICQRCLQPNPEMRYASAEQMADALASWLDRPRWNRHFPRLRSLLWMVIGPTILVSNILVWLLLTVQCSESWLWITLFASYGPLFAAFLVSQNSRADASAARRELWSVWLGHLAGSVATLVCLRVLASPDYERAFTWFYPCWASISAVVFIAKSGNFWQTYRWIGITWAAAAVTMTFVPSFGPIAFGALGMATSVIVAMCDNEFHSE